MKPADDEWLYGTYFKIKQEKAGRVSPTLVAGLPNEDCGLPIQIFGEV